MYFRWNIIYCRQKKPIKVQILGVASKFAKFLKSFSKAQVRSSSNVAAIFSAMTHNLPVLLLAQT